MSCSTSDSPLTVLPSGWQGSTYLNSKVATYHDIAHRIKVRLGAPIVDFSGELTDEQLAMFIDESVEWYTKYAGYTQEYLIVHTSFYEAGCGIKLDEFFNTRCQVGYCTQLTTTSVVTATTSATSIVGTATTLMSAFNDSDRYGHLVLTYDPDSVWTFSPCAANIITISAGSPDPDTHVCGPTTGLISVSAGLATIYPANYNALIADPCTALSAYWGCSGTLTASHVHITGIPACSLSGTNPLSYNNGKLMTVSICNTALDSYGPMPATFTFKTSYAPTTTAYYGTYTANVLGGFKVLLDLPYCVVPTSTWTTVSATFYNVSATNFYGLSSHSASAYQDPDLLMMRKVVGVANIDSGGTFGGIGENYLYGLDYAIAQNLWGGMSVGMNMGTRGFDLVSYELLAQYIGDAKRLMARAWQFQFNRDTQYLKIQPEPRISQQGCVDGSNDCSGQCVIVSCYVEKPIAHVMKERWVHNYALALTMIALGHIRGKFSNVTLFGGGSLNASDIMTQGLEMKEKLETELLTLYGEATPPTFFVG